MINRRFILKVFLLSFILMLFFAAQFYFDAASYFNPAHIRIWLEKSGMLAPVIYMLVMAVAIVISPIPSVPLDFAAGAFFGPFFGTVYSLAGALCGAVISFILARYLGRSVIERIVGGHINFCAKCSNKVLTKIVFISRLVPFISFDVVSYGAGLTKMSLKNFILATFFGMIPFTFIYNYSGSVIVFREGIALITGIILVGLFFLIPYALEKTSFFAKISRHIHREHN